MAGNLNFHPAPGLSEILPGWYSVPQNPVAMKAYGVTYTPGIGEILANPSVHFNEPDNPLRNFVAGAVKPLGQSGCGCGCGGGGGCGKHKGQINGMGVGDFSSDWAKMASDTSFGGSGSPLAVLQDTLLGVPVWAWVAGAFLFLNAGGEAHSYVGRGRRAARAAAGAF